MSAFTSLMNEIDRAVAAWREGAFPFVCLSDRLTLLGAYGIDTEGFYLNGVYYRYA